MTTYRYIVNSILTHIGENFKDAKITRNQVILWVQFYANRIKSQHIKKTDTSGAFITIISNIQVKSDTIGKYVELPKTIFDLEYDKGINFLYYQSPENEFVPFSRCKAGEAWRLTLDTTESPTPDSPVFYRAHTYLRLLGIDGVNVNNLVLGIYDTIDFFNEVADLDEPVDLGAEHLDLVMRGVIELTQFGLLLNKDLTNEGTDDTALKNLAASYKQSREQ